MEDASSGIRVVTRQTGEVQIGDSVDVLGFPEIGDFSPYLEEASFHKTGAGPLPAKSEKNVRGTNSPGKGRTTT